MMTSTVVNSAGLVADIIGVVLLWKFGLPQEISRSGASAILMEQDDADQIAKAKLYDRWATVGIGLLVFGFSLQLISNLI